MTETTPTLREALLLETVKSVRNLSRIAIVFGVAVVLQHLAVEDLWLSRASKGTNAILHDKWRDSYKAKNERLQRERVDSAVDELEATLRDQWRVLRTTPSRLARMGALVEPAHLAMTRAQLTRLDVTPLSRSLPMPAAPRPEQTLSNLVELFEREVSRRNWTDYRAADTTDIAVAAWVAATSMAAGLGRLPPGALSSRSGNPDEPAPEAPLSQALFEPAPPALGVAISVTECPTPESMKYLDFSPSGDHSSKTPIYPTVRVHAAGQRVEGTIPVGSIQELVLKSSLRTAFRSYRLDLKREDGVEELDEILRVIRGLDSSLLARQGQEATQAIRSRRGLTAVGDPEVPYLGLKFASPVAVIIAVCGLAALMAWLWLYLHNLFERGSARRELSAAIAEAPWPPFFRGRFALFGAFFILNGPAWMLFSVRLVSRGEVPHLLPPAWLIGLLFALGTGSFAEVCRIRALAGISPPESRVMFLQLGGWIVLVALGSLVAFPVLVLVLVLSLLPWCLELAAGAFGRFGRFLGFRRSTEDRG